MADAQPASRGPWSQFATALERLAAAGDVDPQAAVARFNSAL